MKSQVARFYPKINPPANTGVKTRKANTIHLNSLLSLTPARSRTAPHSDSARALGLLRSILRLQTQAGSRGPGRPGSGVRAAGAPGRTPRASTTHRVWLRGHTTATKSAPTAVCTNSPTQRALSLLCHCPRDTGQATSGSPGGLAMWATSAGGTAHDRGVSRHSGSVEAQWVLFFNSMSGK